MLGSLEHTNVGTYLFMTESVSTQKSNLKRINICVLYKFLCVLNSVATCPDMGDPTGPIFQFSKYDYIIYIYSAQFNLAEI